MLLRNIWFGKVLGGSGVQGFFGEGYWFHKLLTLCGLDFDDMTFVAKTTTLKPCRGNMPLTKSYTPKFPFPDCIKVRPWRGVILNSVGLSNPGIIALLETGIWQQLAQPFWLSVMSIAGTKERRLAELRIIIEIIKFYQPDFRMPFGLQINVSCPNTGHDPKELIGEVIEILDITKNLGVPIMLKFSIASAPIAAVMQLNDHPDCDAICVSNSVPYNWEGIGQRVWGSPTSPLAKLGGGGVSGQILRPLVCDYIRRLRDAGFKKPINGGGGILSPKDVDHFHVAGASSIFLASIAVLRPWRVAATINRANALKWN